MIIHLKVFKIVIKLCLVKFHRIARSKGIKFCFKISKFKYTFKFVFPILLIIGRKR